MQKLARLRSRVGAAAGVLGVTMLVAACGSSGSNATSGAGTASATSSSATATPAAAKATAKTTAKASVIGVAGGHLTGAGGRALYLWEADTGGKSVCSGACAQAWPPLATKAKPVASAGVKAADLGTISRADGGTQVTYKGHPLYYFAGDSGAGTTTGQGSDEFGAKWWLVSPAGAAITSSGANAPATSSSSSGY